MVIFKDLDAKRIYVNKRQLVRASTLNNKIKIEKNAEKLQTQNESNTEIKQGGKSNASCAKGKYKNVVGNLRVLFIFKIFLRD